MRSNPAHEFFFLIQLENILRSNSNLSSSYGRWTDLKSSLGLNLVNFIWLEEKISLKYLFPGGVKFDPLFPDCIDIADVQTG